MDFPRRWSSARPLLRPTLLPISAPASVLAAGRELDTARPLRRPFLPFLHELCVLDVEGVRLHVTRAWARLWDVDADAVFDAAWRNVHPTRGLTPHPTGLWDVDPRDGTEAARLALPGWLAGFRGNVKGRPVAAIPCADRVLVVGEDEPGGLGLLISTARDLYSGPSRVSPALYTVDADDCVVPYHAPANHPLADEVDRGHVTLADDEYERAARASAEENDPGLVPA